MWQSRARKFVPERVVILTFLLQILLPRPGPGEGLKGPEVHGPRVLQPGPGAPSTGQPRHGPGVSEVLPSPGTHDEAPARQFQGAGEYRRRAHEDE